MQILENKRYSHGKSMSTESNIWHQHNRKKISSSAATALLKLHGISFKKLHFSFILVERLMENCLAMELWHYLFVHILILWTETVIFFPWAVVIGWLWQWKFHIWLIGPWDLGAMILEALNCCCYFFPIAAVSWIVTLQKKCFLR